MIDLMPALSDETVAVGDHNRPAKAAAARLVPRGESVIDRSLLARVTDRTGQKLGLGVMSAKIWIPFELARRFAIGLEDHVRDLARKAGDAEAGRIDDLNSIDRGRRRALQLIGRPARFVGNSLAVDEDILGGLAKAALEFIG